MNGFFSTLSIRTKLLLGYSLIFLVSISLGNLIIYMVVRHTIQTNIEKELTNTTNIILNMVKSAADASIKNYLRSVAEKNRDIVKYYYEEYQQGKMSEASAKEKASEVLLSQRIGRTGYIYCVDSKAILRVHPKLSGADLSKYDFINRQIQSKNGYIEYDWANPGESTARPKALYMTYFGPWDWIISVSSYREEFKDLLNVSDFRENILAVSFGKTGYSFVMDTKGNLIIHPKLQGQNIYDSKDSAGREFIKDICEKKNGKIVYPWQNPGETMPREKLVIFNYIPEFGWIVASSGYLDEFNEPLLTISSATLLTLAFVLLLVVPITWYISSSINKSLQDIMRGFSQGARDDYSYRINPVGGVEIRQLASYYNDFMEKLSISNQNLQASEGRFRLLFENAVEGVFTMTREGKFLTVNPSLARMLGYESQNLLLREVADVGPKAYIEASELERLMSELSRTGMVTGFETTYRRRDGSVIWMLVNARAYTDADGSIATIDGFCSDMTERKKADEAQNKIKEELENRVAERTMELSNYIGQLEQRNVQESLLREMGQLLQVCRNTRESYAIVDEYVNRFFPDYCGVLCLFEATKKRLETAVSWGSPEGIEPEFTQNDCWALRQGKPYSVGDGGNRLFCSHVHEKKCRAYLCMPIIAQGEIVGLLHLQSLPDGDADWKSRTEAREGLVSTFTNHLGLALVNLKLQDRLRDQSLRDPLTGLYNRRFMEEFTTQEIWRVRRYGAPLSMALIDVDHFKKFNDTHGHDAGDLVLKELANRFRNYCRESDIVCRFGGEEFIIIMPSCSLDDAAVKADGLCKEIRERVRIPYRNEHLTVTVSIGVASCPVHGMDIDEVVKAADDALYQAKHGGRDRVVTAEI
ncbi:MAG: cache domain-containing protein [Deltaproteobacteria bacterium]|nr:cache domain-containing protein [Deltaproteobacteria bacterium]